MKLLFFTFFFIISTQTTFSDDRSALLILRSSVGGRTLRWNTTSGDPCIWSGVRCNEAHQITALRLPGDSLSGELPSGVFGTLIHLRTLSLRLNSLIGSLPPDLGSCSGLRNLYLQGNRFSGEIPVLLFGLKDLVRVNLAGNVFSGAIPVGFNGLSRMRTLYLESNKLVGSIPELKLLKLEQFNVSFNSLDGSIPASLGSMDASAFLGNSLCGAPLDSCSGNGNSVNVDENGKKKKKGLSDGAIAGIVIGSVLGFLLILFVLMILCRKKSRKNNRSVDISSLKQQEVEKDVDKPIGAVGYGGMNTGDRAVAVGAGAMAPVGNENGNGKGAVNNGLGVKKLIFFGNATRVFDLEDLLRASAEVLGKGTFGTAYKAIMHVGPAVAVKRLKDVTISENEFKEKIQVVGGMDNANLVLLRAYYFSRDEKLLVYDYMNMGSLSALLHGNKGAGRTPLNWAIRSGIALGAARGIEYLHSQGPNISHGNIKSSNILLTESYDARVSDFGLAHLVGPSSTPNRAAGYRAPEVTDPRKVSQKADVYSFGVLILEVLTGKAPTHALLNDEGVDLPRWVQSIVREEWTSEVFDLELLREQNVEEEMVQLLQLAIDCAAQYPDNRPSMSEVTRRIEDLSRSSGLEYHEDSQPDQIHDVKH